jgi:hypothetical protein
VRPGGIILSGTLGGSEKKSSLGISLVCVCRGLGGFKRPYSLLSLPFGWYCTARVPSDDTLPSKNNKVLQVMSICYCFMVIASLD